MRHARGIFTAALLVLAAGCQGLDLDLSLRSDTAARERLVAGPVDGVARSAKEALKDMGMESTASRDGEAVRVHSRTARGQKFDVVLTRTADGKTRARLEWDGTADDGVGVTLLGALGGN